MWLGLHPDQNVALNTPLVTTLVKGIVSGSPTRLNKNVPVAVVPVRFVMVIVPLPKLEVAIHTEQAVAWAGVCPAVQ